MLMSTAASTSETMDEGHANDQPGRLPGAAKKPIRSSTMRSSDRVLPGKAPIAALVGIILLHQQAYDNSNLPFYE
jgi:hypothetical protein